MGMAEALPVHPEPMLPVLHRVVRREVETRDTVTLTLEAESAPLPSAVAPGQFNMLYAFGVGEVPISVSAPSTVGEPLVHTVRAVGQTSSALHAAEEGGTLGVRGPFGRPWPTSRYVGMDLVLVAGGIGLAPLRGVVHDVLARRGDFRRVFLLYGARHPSELLYASELEEWAARSDLELRVTVDRTTGTEWRGAVGIVPRLLARTPFDPRSCGVFLCGPEVMIEPTVREVLTRGGALDDVHVSLERNMHCAIGLCGHCQLGPYFVCRDGAVFPYPAVDALLRTREL